MKTNTNKNEIKYPLTIAIIDMLDAYHYADIFDQERYAVIGTYSDLDISIALADRLFTALNPNDKTQRDWIKLDAGHDVRIYDAKPECVYKAHEKLPE